jgi:hypothetical protein
MSVITKRDLKNKVLLILKEQGYKISDGGFVLKDDSREVKRDIHVFAKAERMAESEKFIIKNIDLIAKYLVDGKDINVEKIDPQIIEVKEGTIYETIFRWWNLVWWSLPYEHAYGRQMRFIVWDKYHNAPIGLIGLQSPILSWSVRDNYLEIGPKERDYWVNQSMSAQRLGALPPYNYVLGGKLVAYLITANDIIKKFEKKYKKQISILKDRILPARLLFITTTGAYGKSSVYNRLKINKEFVADFIGYSKGSGSFHIPNSLFEDFIKYLEKRNYDIRRGYGSGPSRKLRLINQAMDSLGISNGATHGVQRAVYLFPLVKNLKEIMQKNRRPIWIKRNIKELTDHWKQRWAIPRAEKNKEYQSFVAEIFLNQTLKEIERYKKIYKKFKLL